MHYPVHQNGKHGDVTGIYQRKQGGKIRKK